MASKLQDNYVTIGAALPVALAANPNPIGGAGVGLVTVQPGVVFRVSNIQANILANAGGEFAEFRVLTSAGTAEANTFACLHTSGVGTFKVDAETGDPIGKLIGPFTTATVLQVGVFAQTGAPTGSCTATLERVIPSPGQSAALLAILP